MDLRLLLSFLRSNSFIGFPLLKRISIFFVGERVHSRHQGEAGPVRRRGLEPLRSRDRLDPGARTLLPRIGRKEVR